MTKNKIAVFDVDGTLLKGNIIEPLMVSEVQAGLLDEKYLKQVNGLHENLAKKEISRDEASVKIVSSWAEGLKGSGYQTILNHTDKFVKDLRKDFYPFVTFLLSKLSVGHRNMVCTNEPQFVADSIVKLLGFDGSSSTIYEVVDGSFSGKVIKYNSTIKDKDFSIRQLINGNTLSFAFGDSITDMPMLDKANHPVCINPSEELKEVALSRDWIIASPETLLSQLHQELLS